MYQDFTPSVVSFELRFCFCSNSSSIFSFEYEHKMKEIDNHHVERKEEKHMERNLLMMSIKF